jgi:hypothetical protein
VIAGPPFFYTDTRVAALGEERQYSPQPAPAVSNGASGSHGRRQPP